MQSGDNKKQKLESSDRQLVRVNEIKEQNNPLLNVLALGRGADEMQKSSKNNSGDPQDLVFDYLGIIGATRSRLVCRFFNQGGQAHLGRVKLKELYLEAKRIEGNIMLLLRIPALELGAANEEIDKRNEYLMEIGLISRNAKEYIMNSTFLMKYLNQESIRRLEEKYPPLPDPVMRYHGGCCQ